MDSTLTKSNKAKVIDRATVWRLAEQMVSGLVEQHGLQEIKTSGVLFAPPSPVTAVEQHLDAIERVANWLLDPEL